jgi:sphingomyelin phosphodiesterase
MRFSPSLYALAAAGSFASAAAVEKKDLASTILKDIESAATCTACEVREDS